MVVGTVVTVQAFLPLMRATRGHRRIVLTSQPPRSREYDSRARIASAEAAVTSIGETLDLELGPEGIGTTIVFPSGMLSPEILELVQTTKDLGSTAINPS